MFDIKDYKWSDEDIELEESSRAAIWLKVDISRLVDNFCIDKDDSIAIAKHFSDSMNPKERSKYLFAIFGSEETAKIRKVYTFGEFTTETEGPKDAFNRIPQSETTIHHRKDGGSIKITDDSITYCPPPTYNPIKISEENHVNFEITDIKVDVK
ncbi:MAG: hypothetical protein O7D95_06510 [Betaproteobacteria bacterium]|nr:hypothetical protein [Betaproteobacteria bacterium]